VFRTRRDDLSHESRVKRLDGMRNLAEWHDFADRFILSSDSLDCETSDYLINRGFDTDKALLYSLPREDVDDYLSDLQVRLLAYTNGADAPIIENRQLFQQSFHGLLPLAPVVAVLRRGEVIDGPALRKLFADDFYWVLPAEQRRGGCMFVDTVAGELVTPENRIPCPDLWAALRAANADAVVMRCPGPVEALDRLRVFVVRDPASFAPKVMAAVVAMRTSRSGPFDTLASGAVSAAIDVDTGTIVAAKHLVNGKPEDADVSDATGRTLIGRAVPHWWEIQHEIRQALLRLPMFAVLQIDFSIGGARPLVFDATARVNAAEFQIHGPLMANQVCRRFMREYGL